MLRSSSHLPVTREASRLWAVDCRAREPFVRIIFTPHRSFTGPTIHDNPEQFANKALRRFKQLLEVGEVMETEGQPAGRRNGTTWLDAVAR